MADLNKFHRSKERIAELLNYLTFNNPKDEKVSSFINDLEKSIQIIDNKMEEFEKKELFSN
jgi:hypothetical protein